MGCIDHKQRHLLWFLVEWLSSFHPTLIFKVAHYPILNAVYFQTRSRIYDNCDVRPDSPNSDRRIAFTFLALVFIQRSFQAVPKRAQRDAAPTVRWARAMSDVEQ